MVLMGDVSVNLKLYLLMAVICVNGIIEDVFLIWNRFLTYDTNRRDQFLEKTVDRSIKSVRVN